jgi:galactose oxidase-like protein
MKCVWVIACVLSIALAGPVAAAADAGAEKPVRLNPQIAALGDGQSVRLKTNHPTPLGRGFCQRMPYDPVNKIGLVYGACHNPRGIAQNDVWSFDASTATWTELVKSDPRKQAMKRNEFGVAMPVKGPPRPSGVGHTYGVICFDTGSGKMVSLRGGTPGWLNTWRKYKAKALANAKAAGVSDEMIKNARGCLPWLFDVKTRSWTLACPPEGDTPNHTRAETCVYDPKHKRTLYWSVDVIPQRKGGVFAYDSAKNRWKFSKTKGGPASGIESLGCWDPVNKRVLYFSGNYTKTRQVKAFDYATLTWTDLKVPNWPKLATPHPKRGPYRTFASNGACLAFDTVNGIALVFERPGNGEVRVHPFDVRENKFLPEQKINWSPGAAIKCYYDPDQNAVILNGGRDLQKTQTWAYRYKRAGKKTETQ